MNYELQKKKITYIPMFARGEISERECARLIGITPMSAWRLKNRYLQFGNAVFIHGNTGKTPKNKQYDYNKITSDYALFSGTNFSAFRDNCKKYLHYKKLPSYTTFYKILSKAGIVSPEALDIKKKKEHLPRNERENEGDLVQIDASLHDWFMTGRQVALHGAIDDARHKIVGLYFCENECLLGYYQILLQIFSRTGGFPQEIYSDRSSCFFVNRGATLEEQLSGAEKNQTQWQKTCKELSIELIAAYSPQAKGRIERLWRTLQGRLPFIFRFLKITTIDEANEFLKTFIDEFNNRFSVPAQNPELHWQKSKKQIDFDYLFSVKQEKKTNADGKFIYHGYEFKLLAPKVSCVKFTLCLSESFGLRAYFCGKYYNVELCEPLCDVVGDTMPIVEKNLIYKYFYADTHTSRTIIRAC